MEDCSLSAKNPTLEMDVTAKTMEKNNMSKSPVKISDLNFFKPYIKPLITIDDLHRAHKLHHTFLPKINHGSLKPKLCLSMHLMKIKDRL